MSKQVTINLIKGNSYFCSGIFSIGIYIKNDNAILIDSGNDEQYAKNLSNAIEAMDSKITSIINTHCHPDHCGANSFFQAKFPNIRIYSTHDEKEFIEDPDLAPRCFCGGAAPYSGLKNKYISPQKHSTVTDVIKPFEDSIFSIEGNDFRIIPLPGHTPGSIGIITPDNILYSGDAIFGEETFEKHYILFYTDIEKTLASFKKISKLKVDACVLYHGGLITDVVKIAKHHEDRILETLDLIFSIIKSKSISIDILSQEIMRKFKISENIVAFTLTQTTIRAYVTQLEKERKVKLMVNDGLLQVFSVI